MEDVLVPIGVVGMLFIGLPWLILHYSTQWKRAGTISREDEDLLDELYELGRRLDDRMNTIERIIAADNPEWGRQHLTAERQQPSDRLTQSEEEASPIRRP
jgi:phage shock protein B